MSKISFRINRDSAAGSGGLPLICNTKKLMLFLAAGLPGFIVAFGLNYLLVSVFDISRMPAYAVVLLVQVTINFFSLIAFVFERNRNRSLLYHYAVFMLGVLGFRFADWIVYLLLTSLGGVYFLLAQAVNVVVFSLLKFSFVRCSIEGE